MAETTVLETAQAQAPRKREETREERRFLIPPADIFEDKDGLTVLVDMPGVDKNGVDVRVDDDVLTIEGLSNYSPRQDAVYSEFSLQSFRRQFQLGEEVDQEKISASLKNGVLIVHLPRAEKAKPKQIAVKVES